MANERMTMDKVLGGLENSLFAEDGDDTESLVAEIFDIIAAI